MFFKMRRKLSQINNDDIRIYLTPKHKQNNRFSRLGACLAGKTWGWDGGNLWSSEDGGEGGREGGSHQLILGQCCGQLKYSSMAAHTSCWPGFCQVRVPRYLYTHSLQYIGTYCIQGSLQYFAQCCGSGSKSGSISQRYGSGSGSFYH